LLNGDFPSVAQGSDNRFQTVSPSILVTLIEVTPFILELPAQSGDDLLDLTSFEWRLRMSEASFLRSTSDRIDLQVLKVRLTGSLLKFKQEG
jgi:hypothetical protein